jgi:hypothetical protein
MPRTPSAQEISLRVTLASGALLHVETTRYGTSFVHLDKIARAGVALRRREWGEPVVCMNVAELLSDGTPVNDLYVFISLGDALAIGAVAQAETAQLAKAAALAAGDVIGALVAKRDLDEWWISAAERRGESLDMAIDPAVTGEPPEAEPAPASNARRFSVAPHPRDTEAWIVVDAVTGENASGVIVGGQACASDFYRNRDAAQFAADDLNTLAARESGASR